MSGPVGAWLPDGRRLHFQHGPIDLIVETWGQPEARRAAHAAGWARFATVLDELVGELPLLRRPPGARAAARGAVARAMEAAACAHAPVWVTPMAAVAGAVADAVLAAMAAAAPLDRAVINNGGDVAVLLAPGQALTVAGPCGAARLVAEGPARGVATSGWRGRSFSMGIADAVTATARTAALADVAATLIANAVDLPSHPAITRRPAREMQPDSDLGDRLVTIAVGALAPGEIAQALDRGLAAARAMRARGLILSAALRLGPQVAALGTEPAHA